MKAKQTYPQVGDLVKLENYCARSDENAIVIELLDYDQDYCYMVFLDNPFEKVLVNVHNLIYLKKGQKMSSTNIQK